MAVISPDTFDPLRHYVGVRLQQGVPVVDADWNELEDARRFEERVLMKWFLGDGVPAGSDGFRIDYLAGWGQPENANDFAIRSGVTGTPDGLHNAGRCLVDGMAVMIITDTSFKAQPLHEDHGASADAEAARLGVPKIAALTTPSADGTVVAYLDVWDRLVTPTEDPSLILPGLGTESCARTKREWVVRVGTAVPTPGDAAFLAGHAYMSLATIARHAGVDNIQGDDITDARRTRLSLSDVLARLATLETLAATLATPVLVDPPNEFTPRVAAAGQHITISGRNFNIGTIAVAFGRDTATIVGTPTASQIVVVAPNIGAGLSVNIQVSNEYGSVWSQLAYTQTT